MDAFALPQRTPGKKAGKKDGSSSSSSQGTPATSAKKKKGGKVKAAPQQDRRNGKGDKKGGNNNHGRNQGKAGKRSGSSSNSSSSSSSSSSSTSTSPRKVAFLFLVRRSLNQPEMWNEFFAGPMGKSHTNVYCHPKDPNDVDVPLLKEAVISENVATAWGDVSVTRAILALLKAGLRDRENTKFVLCSESCAPLRPFKEIHAEITSHNKSYFDFMALSDYIHRFGDLRMDIPLCNFKKHATWWILDRKHAQLCVAKQKYYLPAFKKVMVPDEHYFATVLWNESKQAEVICKQTTFVNWDANINWFYVKHRFCQRYGLNILAAGSQLPNQKPKDGMYGKLPRDAAKEWNRICALDKKMYKNDLVAHPVTHGADMTVEDVATMFQSQAFFARKFTKDSNFAKVKKAYLASFGASESAYASTPEAALAIQRPALDPATGKFVLPQYLHSQLFEELQANLAYVRATIIEINNRKVTDDAKGGRFLDGPGGKSATKSVSSSCTTAAAATPVRKYAIPDSAVEPNMPLTPLSALPPPPLHPEPQDASVDHHASNALKNMLGILG